MSGQDALHTDVTVVVGEAGTIGIPIPRKQGQPDKPGVDVPEVWHIDPGSPFQPWQSGSSDAT